MGIGLQIINLQDVWKFSNVSLYFQRLFDLPNFDATLVALLFRVLGRIRKNNFWLYELFSISIEQNEIENAFWFKLDPQSIW